MTCREHTDDFLETYRKPAENIPITCHESHEVKTMLRFALLLLDTRL